MPRAASTKSSTPKVDYRAPAASVEPTLVDAMLAAPRSAEAYRAYAAALTAAGDPQGDVIDAALALEAATGDDVKGAKARATRALKAFIQGRVQPEFPALAEILAKKEKEAGAIKWRWGVIDEIDTYYWKKTPELVQATDRLMRSPLSRFLRQLWWRELEDLVDVSPVETMSALEWLSVQKNPRLTTLPSFARLPRLWKIEIGRSGITDLSPLREATGLRYASLDNSGVSSLAPLYDHAQLWEVWCRNTQVTPEDAAALRARIHARTGLEKPSGGMSTPDVFGP